MGPSTFEHLKISWKAYNLECRHSENVNVYFPHSCSILTQPNVLRDAVPVHSHGWPCAVCKFILHNTRPTLVLDRSESIQASMAAILGCTVSVVGGTAVLSSFLGYSGTQWLHHSEQTVTCSMFLRVGVVGFWRCVSVQWQQRDWSIGQRTCGAHTSPLSRTPPPMSGRLYPTPPHLHMAFTH